MLVNMVSWWCWYQMMRLCVDCVCVCLVQQWLCLLVSVWVDLNICVSVFNSSTYRYQPCHQSEGVADRHSCLCLFQSLLWHNLEQYRLTLHLPHFLELSANPHTQRCSLSVLCEIAKVPSPVIAPSQDQSPATHGAKRSHHIMDFSTFFISDSLKGTILLCLYFAIHAGPRKLWPSGWIWNTPSK